MQSIWETLWRLLKKLKIELPHDLAILFLGIYLEKNIIWRYTYTSAFIETLFIIERTWKQPKMSIDRWMDKDVCVCVYVSYRYIKYIYTHVYNGTLLSHKKNEMMPSRSNLDGPSDYHTKWNKLDRERQISYDITYMCNLKKKVNLFTKQIKNKKTKKKNFWLSKGNDRGINQVFGNKIHTYTLLYRK